MWLTSENLIGEYVELEVLNEQHIGPLQEAVKDGEFWKLWYATVPSPEEMESYVQSAMESALSGNIAYAVRLKSTGDIVGTTRYYNVDNHHHRAMLGYTWYRQSVTRSPVNTECKYLMLKNAFEKHQAIAVEFWTHFFNHRSRQAIERLGAKQDGVLRNHLKMRDGTLRDTVVYSIINSEWPAVRSNLLSKMHR